MMSVEIIVGGFAGLVAVVMLYFVYLVKKAEETRGFRVGMQQQDDANLQPETAISKIPASLTEIEGIGPKRAERLKQAGVSTIQDLANCNFTELSEKAGVSEKRARKWIEEAKGTVSVYQKSTDQYVPSASKNILRQVLDFLRQTLQSLWELISSLRS
jgi:nucleotidyltransferase/DNA polymerase involved in DNA repair